MPVQPGIDARVAAALSGNQLADVASDHRAELQGFHGWNYAAITAVCRQAARAVVCAYDDSLKPIAKTIRKTARLSYGANWRKHVNREDQGELLPSTSPLMRSLQSPNPTQSMSSFMYERVQQLRLHGSCIVWNRRDMAGRICERYVVPRALATPVAAGSRSTMPNGGIYINPSSVSAFASTNADLFGPIGRFFGAYIPIDQLTVHRLPHPFFKGDGASPTTAADVWIDSGSKIDTTRLDYYNYGPYGKMFLKIDSNDVKVIRDVQNSVNKALSDEHTQVVVVGNGEMLVAERTADEMGFESGHDQCADATLAAHGISKAMVGKQEGMTYGSLAASIKAAVVLSIQGDVDILADDDSRTYAPEYGVQISVEYEIPQVEDPEVEDRNTVQDANFSVITVKEYRTKRGLPPLNNELDDYLMSPQGPKPITAFTSPAPSPGQNAFGPPQQQQAVPSLLDVPPVESIFSGKRYRIAVDDCVELPKDTRNWLKKHNVDLVGLDAEADDLWTIEHGNLEHYSFGLQIDELRRRIESVIKASEPKKYGCVMLNIGGAAGETMLKIGKSLDQSLLGVDGLETEPHVTALYGLIGANMEKLVSFVQNLTQPLVEFGLLKSFDKDDDKPLYVEVKSEALNDINAKIKQAFPHAVLHAGFTPHATVGYLTSVEKYVGNACELTGAKMYLESATISLPDQPKVIVPLRQPFIATIPPAPSPKRFEPILVERKSFPDDSKVDAFVLERACLTLAKEVTFSSNKSVEAVSEVVKQLTEQTKKLTDELVNRPPQPIHIVNNMPEINLPEQKTEFHSHTTNQVDNHLPQSEVHVAPANVQVDVAPADVTVNVPEQPATVVNIAPADVTVNVPQQPVADVRVEVNPDITVQMPKPSSATVVRDENNRITGLRAL